MRLEKAVEQERRAESCIEGIYVELIRDRKSSEWLHRRVRECMSRMKGYPRHSQSHVHGFSHGMFVNFFRNSLVYAFKLPCGKLITNSKEAESLGYGPRELTLKSYMTGHYWPKKNGEPDSNLPFFEIFISSLLDYNGDVLSGKSYYIYQTADNGGERWNPKKVKGPISFKSAIDFIAKKDPFIKRASQYKIHGEIYPYFYIIKKRRS